MEFVNDAAAAADDDDDDDNDDDDDDDDYDYDDVYDSEYRLKWRGLKKLKYILMQ